MKAPAMIMAAAALLLLLAPQAAHAHGGGLHAWDFTTEGYNYTNVIVAVGETFTPYNTSRAGAAWLPGALPFFPQEGNSTMNMTGMVQVAVYLDAQCRLTTTLMPLVAINTSEGVYAHKKVYGYGFTGDCSAVGDLYRDNATLGDFRSNLVWFGRECETDENGILFGSAPNIMLVRAPGQGAALRSVLLVPNPADGPIFCADLDWVLTADELTAWATQNYASCSNSSLPTYTARKSRKLF